jgi:hypothetical protein
MCVLGDTLYILATHELSIIQRLQLVESGPLKERSGIGDVSRDQKRSPVNAAFLGVGSIGCLKAGTVAIASRPLGEVRVYGTDGRPVLSMKVPNFRTIEMHPGSKPGTVLLSTPPGGWLNEIVGLNETPTMAIRVFVATLRTDENLKRRYDESLAVYELGPDKHLPRFLERAKFLQSTRLNGRPVCFRNTPEPEVAVFNTSCP